MSMAHSMEVRPPFLDHRIWNLPQLYQLRSRPAVPNKKLFFEN
jgi:hypothetical protein